MKRRLFLAGTVAGIGLPALAFPAWAQADALPSWNDGPAKQSILDFLQRTTTGGGRDWIPVPERIATFDNDGTLWTEQPMYVQVTFAMDRVRALAGRNPQWRTQEPFKSVLANDRDALAAMGEKGLLEIMAATHAGLTTEAFRQAVLDWLATARHPRFKRPYTDLVYQPMLELLALLRANQFKTYIVSGGGIEFMRPWTERVYGIPPEQVVGSSGVTRYELRANDRPVLLKEPKVQFIDDGPGKAEGINQYIGRRPVFAFGNSDGDLEMLQWTTLGAPGRRLGLIVRHDDAEREYAYDRDSHVGRLDKALAAAPAAGWAVVSMKDDWREVLPAP